MGGGMQPVALQDETTGGTKKEEFNQEERWAGHWLCAVFAFFSPQPTEGNQMNSQEYSKSEIIFNVTGHDTRSPVTHSTLLPGKDRERSWQALVHVGLDLSHPATPPTYPNAQ